MVIPLKYSSVFYHLYWPCMNGVFHWGRFLQDPCCASENSPVTSVSVMLCCTLSHSINLDFWALAPSLYKYERHCVTIYSKAHILDTWNAETSPLYKCSFNWRSSCGSTVVSHQILMRYSLSAFSILETVCATHLIGYAVHWTVNRLSFVGVNVKWQTSVHIYTVWSVSVVNLEGVDSRAMHDFGLVLPWTI